MRRDTRGVSTAISHALALGVVAILVVGLISGVGGFFEGKQSSARAEQLDIVGNRLATDLVQADRLASDNSSVRIAVSGPRWISGGQYDAHLVPGATRATLYVNSSGTSRALSIGNQTRVCEGRASGGSMAVVVRDGCLTIEEQ